MPNYILNRNVQMFVVDQSDPLTLPASVTNTDFCLHTKCDLDQVINSIVRPDITGSRQQLAGSRGRMNGTWSTAMSLAGSGTAGVVPDCDPILKALFGQAGTVVADTSVTYAISDAIRTFALYRFRKDTANTTSGVTQHVGMGCVVREATFTLGSDIAEFSASGESIFTLDTDNFANYETPWKGGLSAMPTLPSAPTYNGNAVVGFTGGITIDGNSLVELKSGTVKIQTGNEIVKDTFGSYIGSGVEGDLRTISFSCVLDDNDGSGIAALKQAAFSFTPVDIVLQMGTIAGNTWTFNLNQVQLAGARIGAGSRRMTVEFGDSTAFGTNLSGTDAFTLVVS